MCLLAAAMGTTASRQTKAKSESALMAPSRLSREAKRWPRMTRSRACERDGSDAMVTRALAVMRTIIAPPLWRCAHRGYNEVLRAMLRAKSGTCAALQKRNRGCTFGAWSP